MRAVVFVALVATLGCSGETLPVNACATTTRVVTCDEQNFYTFSIESVDGDHPTWLGNQCRAKPCVRGDSCEALLDGTFVEGVCE